MTTEQTPAAGDTAERLRVGPDEALIQHPDLPATADAPARIMRESLPVWLTRGWSQVELVDIAGYAPAGAGGPVAVGGPEQPAGNAGTEAWRDYATALGVTNAADYSRDELRDHFQADQPLPSKE